MAKPQRKASKPRRRARWTAAHVRRAFWRAGFGATPAEVDMWTARGRSATLDWLVYGDGPAKLEGPGPSAGGRPLDRVNEPGHDVLWWLDRMVRTTRPLEEKMTLFWHDHFATRDVTTPLALRQNEMLRRHCLGRFGELLREVTLDPAMQQFLSVIGSDKSAPNENYARELMELFTLGSGYTEDDVREASRALTGFKEVEVNGALADVTFDPARHDAGPKRIFGASGRFGWEDVLRLCLGHERHAPFLVGKLWDFFVATPLDRATRRTLVRTYRSSGLRIAPVVRRIIGHPDMYRHLHRPDMVKWPAVLVAGQLRAMGAPVDRLAWAWLMASMGQTLFAPPSVAGWDWGPRWLSSNAMRARFEAANQLTRNGGHAQVKPGSVAPDSSADAHIGLARAAVGSPVLTHTTTLALERLVESFASTPEATSGDARAVRANAETLQRALRHLLISGPDNQLC